MAQLTLKTKFKRALERGDLLIVGTNCTRNGWTKFRVFIPEKRTNRPGFVLVPVQVPEAAYWSERLYSYKCTAWGTDRRLEVILKIGYALGLSFDEIKQNYKWVQG